MRKRIAVLMVLAIILGTVCAFAEEEEAEDLAGEWELYVGGENLTNYKQNYPIISADNPNSEDFDASMVWGPLSGIRAYLGMRFQIK